MASNQKTLLEQSASIESYLTLLETEIGQMHKELREIASLVRKLGWHSQDYEYNCTDVFKEKAILVEDNCKKYSAELLELFPTIENGIINLEGEERRDFLGFRGRYDVVRNDLTNIRRNLFEYNEELSRVDNL